MTKEVDIWMDTEEWRLALILHERFCTRGHQMDQCWGLNLPYDLNQDKLSRIQRHYVGMARVLMEAFDEEQINLIITVVHEDWMPEVFPNSPLRQSENA